MGCVDKRSLCLGCQGPQAPESEGLRASPAVTFTPGHLPLDLLDPETHSSPYWLVVGAMVSQLLETNSPPPPTFVLSREHGHLTPRWLPIFLDSKVLGMAGARDGAQARPGFTDEGTET